MAERASREVLECLVGAQSELLVGARLEGVVRPFLDALAEHSGSDRVTLAWRDVEEEPGSDEVSTIGLRALCDRTAADASHATTAANATVARAYDAFDELVAARCVARDRLADDEGASLEPRHFDAAHRDGGWLIVRGPAESAAQGPFASSFLVELYWGAQLRGVLGFGRHEGGERAGAFDGLHPWLVALAYAIETGLRRAAVVDGVYTHSAGERPRPTAVGDASWSLAHSTPAGEAEQVSGHLRHAIDAAQLADRAKRSFWWTMGHEIRTPMNAILGLVEVVLEVTQDERQRKLLMAVQSNADQLLQRVDEILDFSEFEATRRGSTVQRRFAEWVPEESGDVPPSDATTGESTGRRGVILLVEDHDDSRVVAELMLSYAGYAIDLAESGEAALERLEARRYDMVVTDVQMPGIDGYALSREIRRREREQRRVPTPVIALTADVIGDARARCLEAGMNDFVAKPVRRKVLLDVVGRWMRASSRRAAAEQGLFSSERAPWSRSASERPGLGASQPATSAPPQADSDAQAAMSRSALGDDEDRVVVEADVADLVETYLARCRAEVSSVSARLEARDYGAIARIAHNLKGSAPAYGFARAGLLGAELEQAATLGDHEAIGRWRHALQDHLERVRWSVVRDDDATRTVA